jgi:hypothetical protein
MELAIAAVMLIPVNTPEPSFYANNTPAMVKAMLTRPPIHAHHGVAEKFSPEGQPSRHRLNEEHAGSPVM